MAGMAIGGLGAAIGGIGGFLGASKQADAAKNASQMQYMLGQQAIAQQQAQYAQTRGDLAPYRDAGATGANMLTQNLPWLTTPFTADQKTLESTPGYQWNLSQGLKSTQSAAAARGLGVSGAALKGAATYATGLADSTLKTQFDIDQTNKTNAYNKLLGTAQMGASAAGSTGLLGANSANQQSNLLTGMGNTYGASQMAQANAWTNGLTGIGNAASGLGQLYNYNQLLNQFKPQQSLYGQQDNGGYAPYG
jgi:hypothetical protein